MVRTSVLHQTPLLIPHEDHAKTPEFNFNLKEQEWIYMIKKSNNMKELKQVHGQILKLGLICSSFCAGNLLATCALSEWGSMDYACSIFREISDPGSFEYNTVIRGHVKDMNSEEALLWYIHMIEDEVEPDNFSYPALLKVCARFRAHKQGKQIHGQIFKFGQDDDVFVQNSLINMYGKCGEIKESCIVFEQMDQRTIASWSALIAAHANLGLWSECLKLFGEMNYEGCWRAEESTLVSVISACTHLDALDFGKATHGYLARNMSGLNNIVETSLIDMYVKCGSLDKGLFLFQRMANKNQMSYSAIISGLALHGRGEEALSIYHEMLKERLDPDDVVYVGVLSACSHAGLVEQGLKCFDRMRLEHQIEPTIQHYGCMVDLLGRAGRLEEALELIKGMPMEPNDVLWRSLLSACRVHHNVELGEFAAEHLFQMNSRNASDYVMLCNMYAQAQMWEKKAVTRTKMANEGISQVPGSCLVEINRKMYKFVSQDRSHPCSEEVYEMLHQMEWQLKFEGYSPDTSLVWYDVDEEEKRQRLSTHSQKLAIALALIKTSQGSPIRIVRNVRMCSDCHTYAKLISMIYERDIVVRDRNRFHHFKDGTCSCKDYW
ncbi:PREDICTED: pentatricopeptide repeat-containing protein At1g31920 [Nicotiana attenuata]|uniref:Pentatricopeptide repeat-containing protein n=1 Tax=Nicotiana attenuata TaxID=49451 RepID=A0A1J6IWP3_NICAT|nr:PREDICTED: pentatricopeptide repeat-containing protein At1g31920 [Nicotiana attenuata]OIS99560.1 pentatricopeptide repeat-containing protein [Nicotiana attenuata]